MNRTTRIVALTFFGIWTIISAFAVFNLKFAFSFDQFFPKGDDDLAFFQEFLEDFAADDNFMLIAVRRADGVFEQDFLTQFHDLTLQARELPHVTNTQSLTKFSYPIKTPFAVTTVPAIHIDQPERYARDRAKILQDERFVYNLISEDATTLVVALETTPEVGFDESAELLNAMDSLLANYNFEEYHLLGRAYFQKELVEMQQREVIRSTVISAILVALIMFWIFRRPIGILIALSSIGLGLLLFMGLLALLGRELNAIAALYPVLMVIVGTSDVIHIMSKYVDELKKGIDRRTAIRTTIKEIGLATLLTSATTAIGFATLMTSKVGPIRDFGLNAALGVLVAYVTVIGFTTVLLSMCRAEQIIKLGRGEAFWTNFMNNWYNFTRKYPRQIALGTVVTVALCGWGISKITTNYAIISNLPRGEKITEDFLFFEQNLTSFRPMDIAVIAQEGYQANDYEVLREVAKVEDFLNEQAAIQGVTSYTTVYKSINQMFKNNRTEAYQFPANERTFDKYRRYADQISQTGIGVLISKDEQKARISSRLKDIGSENIKALGVEIDEYIAANTDPQIAEFRRTGTGVMLDKNSEYIRVSLLQGLGIAILIVSILMAILFKNARMLLISLAPNLLPLLLAGALLGFLGIELEAGVSIIFAVIFGIAVDDTIHFLSKYKLSRNKGMTVEAALHTTFLETGKAICLTSIILFFGFLVMLFSVHPPSVTVGLLISLTLFSALIADLMIIPLLIRWLGKE